jgi:hypothetical protein
MLLRKLRILIKKLFRKYLRYVASQASDYVPMIYPLDCKGFKIDNAHLYRGKSDYINDE